MDIARPSQAKAKLRKRIIIGSVAALVLIAVTVALARLKPAVPNVDRSLVWIGTVKRGPMVRQVHGPGTLVPVDIRWLAARTDGRVDHIVLLPGAMVKPDSVIMVLSSPTVTQAALDAESQLKAEEAQLASTKVTVEQAVLQSESEAANARAAYESARLNAEVNGELYKEGLVSELSLKLLQVTAQQDDTLNTLAQRRFAFQKDNVASQLAVEQAKVDQLRDAARLKRAEADALNVRAGMNGILQLVPVEVGAQVTAGLNLARVADPSRLKAQIQIAETQAKDIQIGQSSQIDTRNGVVDGKVSRVDPSVQNGTVTVDVALPTELPLGARPDLSVDGVIELEHLDDVVFVERPAFGQENSTTGIFLIDEDGSHADRVQVQLGKSSVNTIQILKGLKPGDRVILSDMSQWDSHDRIKLN
ncbi:MAG TPA: efflux RND transporter periplasmic adaptor subunit [Opitutaceae bacterium]